MPETAESPTLTARQAETLAFLRRYTAGAGMPPTIREIADELGVRSPNAVMGHLNAPPEEGGRAPPGRRAEPVVGPRRRRRGLPVLRAADGGPHAVRTCHSRCPRGKRVLIVTKDGERIEDRFDYRSGRFVHLASGRKVEAGTMRVFRMLRGMQ